MLILALETSTTSAKAMLYCSKDGIIDMITRKYPTEVNNTSIQDSEGVLHELAEVSRQICIGRDIELISLSGIWHSLLLCDKNMKAQTKIISWANTRAADVSSRFLKDKEGVTRFYNTTGCPVAPNYPYFKLLHLKEQGYKLEDYYIMGQGSYITYRLTGKRIVTDCMASGSGLLNIHDKKYDKTILEELGIDEEQLCKIVTYKDAVPLSEEGAKLLGLRSGIPVIPASADGALNQVGAGALDDGAMTFSVGTSAAIRLSTSKPLIPDIPSTWSYLSPTQWLSGAATSGACNCIDWFNDDFYQMSYDEIEKCSQEEFDTPVFLPFLFGERSPGWQGDKRGAFIGIEPYHTRRHFYQAIQEGILFNVYQNYNVLCDMVGEPKKIILSGGIVNSQFWTQMCADIFGAIMEIPTINQSSLMGAVILGLDYLKVIPSPKDYQFEKGEIVRPNPGMKLIYKKKYEKYLYFYNKIS